MSEQGQGQGLGRGPGRGRRRAAALLLAAAALAPAAALDAQPAGAAGRARAEAPPLPSEPAALGRELVRARREQEAAARRLERFIEAMPERRATALLVDSLTRLVERHAELASRAALAESRLRTLETRARVDRDVLVARSAPRGAGPAGWFGVHVETLDGDARPGQPLLVSSDYPKVLSVEPGSPAARGGVQAGDRLVAIGRVDLRREPFDYRQLEPGRTLPVRVQRDGQLRELAVTITARPRTFATGVTMSVGADPAGAVRVRATTVRSAREPGPAMVAAGGALPRGAVAVVHGTAVPAASREPVSAPLIFYNSPSVVTVAGAEVLRLSPELRETLDVANGVFVVQVARSSPAERAGLQQGDVLVRAGGVALSSPLGFQQVIAAAAEAARTVRIDLVRAKRARTVEMRW